MAPESPRPLYIPCSGSPLEYYEVGRQIGEGAYAVVKEATEKATGRRVAVKVYDKRRLKGANRERAVEREIRLLQRIRDPHIVEFCSAYNTATHVLLWLICRFTLSWSMSLE
jgi:serine/threonine protein kinase